jgi:hypothetical protein
VSDEFVAYRGDADLHDGEVADVAREGDHARVVVKAENGRMLEVTFAGVATLTERNAVGMLLYALAEMAAEPLRRFVFVPWDEESDAELEVLAESFGCREAGGLD